MKIIKNVNVYAPEKLGKKDLLIAGGNICQISDNLDIPENWEVEVIDGEGLIATPGFIDSHVHILGGGGEGGFANRTPEATLSGLTRWGITTVVGCLGTDGYGRDLTALIAKIKGLREQGITAYGYTGNYQIPVRTLTGSITQDIMVVDEFIGTGEIAISDHRSSQPTYDEFLRVCADTRLGGILSGKAGIINIHLGDSPRKMDMILRAIEETEIPSTQFLPTHVNRNAALFDQAVEYAKLGGTVDFTGNEDIDYWVTVSDEVRVCDGIKRMLDEGISSDLFTISSDGQGSLPLFSADGQFLGIGMGQSSCLLKEVRECVQRENIPLEIAIKAITANPARVLCLDTKGQIKDGFDADLCLMTEDLNIHTVIAKGQVMVKDGEPIVKGMFE